MSVHNLRTERMWTRDDIYVGRARHEHNGHLIETFDGYFGNPFRTGRDGGRNAVVEKFEVYARERLDSDPEWRGRVAALHGKRLFCFCAPLPCHADVLERLAAELNGGSDGR